MPTTCSSSNVPFDTDGFNTDIRWRFVGRGGNKSMSTQHKAFEGSYSGISKYVISQMGKKEERLRAEEFQNPDFMMHGRSHLILPVASDVHEYQKNVKEQICHENTWHESSFPRLPRAHKRTSTRGNKYFEEIHFGHVDDDDDEDEAPALSMSKDDNVVCCEVPDVCFVGSKKSPRGGTQHNAASRDTEMFMDQMTTGSESGDGVG